MKNKIKDSFLFTTSSDLCEMGPWKFTKTVIKTGIFAAASYGVGILIVKGFRCVKNHFHLEYTDDDFNEEFPDVTQKTSEDLEDLLGPTFPKVQVIRRSDAEVDTIKHAIAEGCHESAKRQGLSNVATDLCKED